MKVDSCHLDDSKADEDDDQDDDTKNDDSWEDDGMFEDNSFIIMATQNPEKLLQKSEETIIDSNKKCTTVQSSSSASVTTTCPAIASLSVSKSSELGSSTINHKTAKSIPVRHCNSSSKVKSSQISNQTSASSTFHSPKLIDKASSSNLNSVNVNSTEIKTSAIVNPSQLKLSAPTSNKQQSNVGIKNCTEYQSTQVEIFTQLSETSINDSQNSCIIPPSFVTSKTTVGLIGLKKVIPTNAQRPVIVSVPSVTKPDNLAEVPISKPTSNIQPLSVVGLSTAQSNCGKFSGSAETKSEVMTKIDSNGNSLKSPTSRFKRKSLSLTPKRLLQAESGIAKIGPDSNKEVLSEDPIQSHKQENQCSSNLQKDKLHIAGSTNTGTVKTVQSLKNFKSEQRSVPLNSKSTERISQKGASISRNNFDPKNISSKSNLDGKNVSNSANHNNVKAVAPFLHHVNNITSHETVIWLIAGCIKGMLGSKSR